MSPWEAVGVFAAGIGAGTINTIVGSGTLITFPVLLAVGLPPVTANVSNTLGLVPGSLSGAYGYRQELSGQRDRLIRLGAASAVGGLLGAVLLLGLMGLLLSDTLQRINATKNILAALVNGVAAIVFLFASHIDWTAALLIAAGSVIGGQIGSRVGRKLPPTVLRGLIVAVGLTAMVKLLVG